MQIEEQVLKAAQAASLAAEALLLEEEEDAKRVEAARKKKKAAKKSRSKKKTDAGSHPPTKDGEAERDVHDAMAGLSLAEPPHVEEAEEEEEDEDEDETLLRRYVLGQQTSQHATTSAKGGRARTASAQDRRVSAKGQKGVPARTLWAARAELGPRALPLPTLLLTSALPLLGCGVCRTWRVCSRRRVTVGRSRS